MTKQRASSCVCWKVKALILSRMVVREAPEDQVVAVYVHAETGQRLFSGVQRWGREQLRVDELDKDYITSADFLHLDGFHFEAALQAAQWMHEAGKTVMLDIIKAPDKVEEPDIALLPYVDVLISGCGVAKALTGKDDIFAAGVDILKLGPRIFVQTDGENGCYTVTSSEQFHTPAFPTEVIDTTGAGDVFHGAFIVGLQHGWSLRDIVRFSAAVSALNCTKLGGRAGIPTMAEALAFLREQGILIQGDVTQ
jgi:sugar/nucleoside kinase (ribokinase family)